MTFTLPASAFPPANVFFTVSLPLETAPSMLASDFVQALGADVLFYLHDSGNILPITASDLIENAGNLTIDFLIEAGIGYLIFKSSPQITDVIFSGDGWCNIFNSGNNTTSPCP